MTARLDEVEQELVRLLSLRAHDLQLFSSRQDQLLQSHYHSLSAAIQTAQIQMTKLKQAVGDGDVDVDEINGRWNERKNLKRFWVYCEEIQRDRANKNNISDGNSVNIAHSSSTVYQTPAQNDSKVNISTASLTNLFDLSLD